MARSPSYYDFELALHGVLSGWTDEQIIAAIQERRDLAGVPDKQRNHTGYLARTIQAARADTAQRGA